MHPARQRMLHLAATALAVVTVLAVFVPFRPLMPAADLDTSWMVALNQAVAQGLAFGRDIVFTLGPYAAVFTGVYHPATDARMMAGSLWLALSFCVALHILCRGRGAVWLLPAALGLLTSVPWRDAAMFCSALAAGMAAARLAHETGGGGAAAAVSPPGPAAPAAARGRADAPWWLAALLFAQFGLLPLIKGSMLPLCAGIALLSAGGFVAKRNAAAALACLLAPVAAGLVCWLAAGQELAGLAPYFGSSITIIGGYSASMSMSGDWREILVFLAGAAAVMALIAARSELGVPARLQVSGLMLLYLFIAFKAGFVRHDLHAVTAGTSLLLAALLLPAISRSRLIAIPVLVCGLAFAFIWHAHLPASLLQEQVARIYGAAWEGAGTRLFAPSQLDSEYASAVSLLRTDSKLPRLPGTSDIYSYTQADLISSGNQWSPRPVFQSYAAYTPTLSQLNRAHLLGSRAPDNIFFRIAPIDSHLPSIEDSASWEPLLQRYRPVGQQGDYLLLNKEAGAQASLAPLAGKPHTHAMRDVVRLPAVAGILYASIDIQPTLLGRAAGLLFKPGPLVISLDMANGERRIFRLVPGMGSSPFLLSPLVESSREFAHLYGKLDGLAGKRVSTLSIDDSAGPRWFWQRQFSVRFFEVAGYE